MHCWRDGTTLNRRDDEAGVHNRWYDRKEAFVFLPRSCYTTKQHWRLKYSQTSPDHTKVLSCTFVLSCTSRWWKNRKRENTSTMPQSLRKHRTPWPGGRSVAGCLSRPGSAVIGGSRVKALDNTFPLTWFGLRLSFITSSFQRFPHCDESTTTTTAIPPFSYYFYFHDLLPLLLS